VIRNYRDTSVLTMYDESQSRKRLQAADAVEIEVPCLTEVTRNKLQLANLTVGKGCLSPKIHLLDRSRCQSFHQAMTSQFDKARELILP
jgi:hypothetical protein